MAAIYLKIVTMSLRGSSVWHSTRLLNGPNQQAQLGASVSILLSLAVGQ